MSKLDVCFDGQIYFPKNKNININHLNILLSIMDKIKIQARLGAFVVELLIEGTALLISIIQRGLSLKEFQLQLVGLPFCSGR